jgi:hypothetical protein
MDSNQIDAILSQILGRRRFRGVYPSDRIPFFRAAPFPYGLVINTDIQGQPGKHWQAIWVLSQERVEFFDSFGDGPRSLIKNYLNNHFKIINENKKKVQKDYEISCGPFVIYFLVKRSRDNKSMDEIVMGLMKKNKFSDAYVKLFVHSLVADKL